SEGARPVRASFFVPGRVGGADVVPDSPEASEEIAPLPAEEGTRAAQTLQPEEAEGTAAVSAGPADSAVARTVPPEFLSAADVEPEAAGPTTTNAVWIWGGAAGLAPLLLALAPRFMVARSAEASRGARVLPIKT